MRRCAFNSHRGRLAYLDGWRDTGRPLQRVDHNSDDNADDSCALNHIDDKVLQLLNSLVSDPAWSWQCGGQGFESP
jgi:hypothetical protein